ncbi:MAG: right-handed parallel beta-helix repeat-containing protein [Thermoguttaceae bacterium]|nr:right-handed parallel beta-helix repeat-containing protein [Thermoguttaceae bacterium]
MNRRLNTRKLHLESLEQRALLAVVAGAFEQLVPVPAPTEAAEWVVNTLDDSTAWDSSDDVVSLREAIGRAQSGDIVLFDSSLAGGTIFLDGAQLEIKTDLSIDATSIGGITIDAFDQSRVFSIGSGASVDFHGLTVTGGWTDGNGGGIYVASSGSLTLNGCAVTKNTATNSGGGIYSNYGTLTIINSTVAENTASSYGGGIYSNRGTLTIIDSTVAENTATSNGGGIYNTDSSTLTLTNCKVSGNTATDGGGIFIGNGQVTLTDSTVSENTANSGGGIYNNNGSLTLANCTVSGNTADYAGGGIYNEYNSTKILGSIIFGNTASGYYYGFGGGIYNNNGSLTLANCTVSGNTASGYEYNSGGIYCRSGELTLTNSIVSLNIAYGGYAKDSNIFHASPIYGSNNIIGLDPGFVVAPIFEDGILVNADEMDLSLNPESIAIDTGNNAVVETETDLAGNTRIAAAWREIATVDIGAFEYQGTVTRGEIETPSTVVTTVLDLLDETDGLISLREAILYAAAGETITFDPSLTSRTIVLDGAELMIDKNLSIDASALGGITIDGDNNSRNILYLQLVQPCLGQSDRFGDSARERILRWRDLQWWCDPLAHQYACCGEPWVLRRWVLQCFWNTDGDELDRCRQSHILGSRQRTLCLRCHRHLL